MRHRRLPVTLILCVAACGGQASGPSDGLTTSVSHGSGDASAGESSASTDGSAGDSGGTGSGGDSAGEAGDSGSGPTGGETGSSDGGSGGDSGAVETGDSGGDPCAGPQTDQNGVAYVDIPGFAYAGGVERFDWRENFKSNGSMRHDFEGTVEGNQCVLGYVVVDGPDDEEFSAKLGGGPHTDSHSDWADTHDVAISNFAGDRTRIRWEATHPDYQSGPSKSIDVGDLRGKWVGVMGCKLNLDQDDDGELDHVWYLGWVDPDGLDGNDRPMNGWVQTLDLVMHVDDVQLKSPTEPYVVTIGQGDEAQATLRIDEQDSSYEYEYVAYRSPVACPG